MRSNIVLESADLFCGGGGTSTGMLQAAKDLDLEVNLLAINHWPTAINSHTLNHPTVRHKCENLDTIKPRSVVPGGRLHIMAASPECTHHSLAAGGRPKNDQSRATAWHVCRWASDLTIDNIFIENVREFLNWGPLGANGKPIKSRKGETFKAFIKALESMGYRVEYRIQNAADFGDPTTRQRLIIMARRGDKPIVWPAETHGPGRKPYRTAREVIDWDLKGKSIFNRKKPLSANTMRRIAAGLKKFGGVNAEPFLVMLYGTNNARSVDRPMPTVTSGGNHIGVVEPFLIPRNAGAGREDKRAHSVDEPMRTVTCKDPFALVQPFLTHLTHHGNDEQRCHSVDKPTPTVTGAHRGELALIEPMVLGQHGGATARPVSQPLPTVCGKGAIALIEPFVVKYYGTAKSAKGVDLPLDTVTAQDRFALVEPVSGKVVAEMDILLRMLQPHELAAAMSFPKGYKFYGSREDQVKQIGNAVAVELSRAHCLAMMQDYV